MSGLGTTVDPSGEPGSLTHNVVPQSETTPDQPAQISQTTAIQTLDQLLHMNWIYDSTFTASTTMPAGTVLFVKPIHPLEWNWPNRRVASMFNAWTGSGKIRYRPLATAWYGGSIRVGFLPPNMTMTDIYSIPLEVLTSYPNKDIDPKNTAWVDFRGPDQREIAYHYMAPFDDTRRQNFGGYIVFYVAGKLVTQAPDFTTIQFIVETAGDFMYDQPSPRALEPSSVTQHPLGPAIDIPLIMQPLCDSADSCQGNIVQVCKNTVTSLTVGGATMSAVGRNLALFKNTTGLELLNTKLNGSSGMPRGFDCWKEGGVAPDLVMNTSNSVPRINCELGTPIAVCANGLLPLGEKYQEISLTALNDADDTLGLKYTAGPTKTVDNAILQDLSIMRTTTNTGGAINPALAAIGAMKLSPMAGGESIVIFGNVHTRNFAPQTMPQAHFMGKWPHDMADSEVSYLYNLVNSTGTPLLTIRLNPNGMFTSNSVAADVVYDNQYTYLRYVGTLPVSSPLPPMSAVARNLQRTLARYSRKPDITPYKDEISNEIELA